MRHSNVLRSGELLPQSASGARRASLRIGPVTLDDDNAARRGIFGHAKKIGDRTADDPAAHNHDIRIVHWHAFCAHGLSSTQGSEDLESSTIDSAVGAGSLLWTHLVRVTMGQRSTSPLDADNGEPGPQFPATVCCDLGVRFGQALAVSRVLAVVCLTEERRRAFFSPDDVASAARVLRERSVSLAEMPIDCTLAFVDGFIVAVVNDRAGHSTKETDSITFRI